MIAKLLAGNARALTSAEATPPGVESREEQRKRMREEARKIKDAAVQPPAVVPNAGADIGAAADKQHSGARPSIHDVSTDEQPFGARPSIQYTRASLSHTAILANLAATSSASETCAATSLATLDDVQVQVETHTQRAETEDVELQCRTLLNKKLSSSALPSLQLIKSPAPSHTRAREDNVSAPVLPTPTTRTLRCENAGAEGSIVETPQFVISAGVSASQDETESREATPMVHGLQETGENVAAAVALFAKLEKETSVASSAKTKPASVVRSAKAVGATAAEEQRSGAPMSLSHTAILANSAAASSASETSAETSLATLDDVEVRFDTATQQATRSPAVLPGFSGTNGRESTKGEDQAKASPPKDTIDDLIESCLSSLELNLHSPRHAREPQDAAHERIDSVGNVEFSIQPRVHASLPSLEAAKSLPRLNTSKPYPSLASPPKQSYRTPDKVNRGKVARGQDSKRLLFSVDEDADGIEDSDVLKADKEQKQNEEKVKRNEIGDYELLVAPSQDSWDIARRAWKASQDRSLSEELEVAVKSTGFTWACVTPAILLSALRKTTRRGTAWTLVFLCIWSAMYHVSISICLRQLILWLHNCSTPNSGMSMIVTSDSASMASSDPSSSLANYTSLSQRYTCEWTNRSMQAMLNHTFGIAGDFSVRGLGRSIVAANDDSLHLLALNRGEGIKWALLLLGSLLVQAVALQASLYASARTAGEARMRLMSLIYGKALASAEFCDTEMRDTQGGHAAKKLNKLMLEDVDVVVKAEQNRPIQRLLALHCIVSVLVMALDLLWTNVLVVVATLLCTGLIIFILCYTIYVTSSRSRHPASSLRVDRMVELLELYVEVALLGWQDLFIDAIDDVRDLEHQRVTAQAIIKGVIFTWAVIAGPLSLACLLLASSVRTDCRAFFTPGLLLTMCHTSALTIGTSWFVVNFASLCEWQPSLKRIVSFMIAQDRTTHEFSAKESTLLESVISEAGVAVKVTGAAFVWRPKVDKRCFRIGVRGRELNLTIRKRERLSILAPKCEGKSSFLCAIAGLMPRDRGNVQLVGKLFYCLEHPLLIDGTIQENILFGLPYDEAMYKRALYCSCLDDKLDQWRLRDLTRVGRAKGGMGFSPIAGAMALDGRHRTAVALARAIYADSDIYLFDNIFQALGDDSEKAWQRCVTEQLCKATVICTFNDPGAAVPILKACDRILLLGARRFKDPAPGGSIVSEIFDIGSYAELYQRG
jgi:ABC-type multidrug transport system fused ATPase/permease subunit